MNTVKYIFFILSLSLNSKIKSQNYEMLLNEAKSNIQEKKYCKAVETFGVALKTKEGLSENNPFIFYAAASSEAYCGNTANAINLLSKAEKKGLVNTSEDLGHVKSDSAFIKLHSLKGWNEIINSMTLKISEKKNQEDKLNKEWDSSIRKNALNIKNKRSFAAASGFALYFTKAGGVEVPYLVYIPKKYNGTTPVKMIVYLHGGVVNTDEFNYGNHQIQREPIFSAGEDLNAIVVYPFGKKDFGWVNQQAAFDNIFTVISQVIKNFTIDRNNIIIGGMSNGGTATFYYASQKPNIFKGFFAISSNPDLLQGKITFSNLSQGKELITLNSKDDSVYDFKSVENIYMKNKEAASDWNFKSVNDGGHGLIYNPEKGSGILKEMIRELFDK